MPDFTAEDFVGGDGGDHSRAFEGELKSAQNADAKQLKAKHEDLAFMADRYDVLLSMYDGGEFFKRFTKQNGKHHLIRHPREVPYHVPEGVVTDPDSPSGTRATKKFSYDPWEDRHDRAFLINYFASIVDEWFSHLRGADGFERDADDQIIKSYWEGVNAAGVPIDDFMFRCVGPLQATTGMMFTVHDMPKVGNGVRARDVADEEKLGLVPRSRVIYPQDMVNWAWGDDGAYDWVRYEYSKRNDLDPFGEVGKSRRVFTWTRHGWFDHEIKDNSAKLVEWSPHQYGFVPVLQHVEEYSRSRPELGKSRTGDLADVLIELYQVTSEISKSMTSECHALLAIAADSLQPGMEVILGHILPIATTMSGQVIKPEWISPSSSGVTSLMEREKALRDSIRFLALFDELQNESGGGAESGKAKQWRFHRTNRGLVGLSNAMSGWDMEISLAANRVKDPDSWRGDPRATRARLMESTTIQYPKTFDIVEFQEKLSTLMDSMTVASSETLTISTMMDVVENLHPGMSEDDRVKIEGELLADFKKRQTVDIAIG